MKKYFKTPLLSVNYYQLTLIVAVTILNILTSFGQRTNDYSPKTPDAASINKYGEYSVGHFTGKPNISIPISVSEELPISLNYNSGGNKPEEHYGWVGQGWNLNVGGVITRVKRGLHDEFQDVDITNHKPAYIDNNWRMKGGAHNTWDDNLLDIKKAPTETLVSDSMKYRVQYADLEPDEFVFNFGNYSGSFLLNHDGNWVFRGNNPNEFKLQVTLTSGFPIPYSPQITCVTSLKRIYTAFIITTSDGTEYYFGGDLNSIDMSWDFSSLDANNPKSMFASAWQLTKIKYTDGKEIKFFYEDKTTSVSFQFIITKSTNAAQATGTAYYWTSNTSQQSRNVSTTSFDIQKAGYVVVPSYLTKIETPYEVIKFNKEQITGYLDYGDLDKYVVYNNQSMPEYQALINQFCINTYSKDFQSKRKWFKLSDIQCYSKVDNAETTTLLRKFKFTYNDPVSNPTTTNPKRRLRLIDVRQINVADATQEIKTSSFEYNSTFLPDYNSDQIDHWGYHNGKNPLPIPSSSPASIEAYSNNYPSTREPDFAYMQAEILQQMNYPTGGYTKFEYEQHNYRAAIKREIVTGNGTSGDDRYSAYGIKNDYTADQGAGGLRISKIISNEGTTNYEKSYLYVKNYTPTATNLVSSGVLDGIPTYFDAPTGTVPGFPSYSPTKLTELVLTGAKYMSEQSIAPLNLTEGSPVSYSEVVEKLSDGSYTIYKFTNSDQQTYRNRTSLDFRSKNNSNIINVLRDPIIDFGHMRGRLYEQQVYNNVGKVVKKIANTYLSTMNVDNAVRAITYLRGAYFLLTIAGNATTYERLNDVTPTGSSNYIFGNTRVNSYYMHVDPNFLYQTVTTDYYYDPVTQASSEITITTDNDYDSRKNIIKQTVTHLNNTEAKSNITTDYLYAYDKDVTTSLVVNPNVTETVESMKQLMLIRFMIGIPLETKNNFNKGSKVEYNSFPNGNLWNGVLPYIFYSQNNTGGFTEQFRINSYSNYDKPTQTQSKGTNQTTPSVITTKTDYIWSNGLLQSKTFGDLKWVFAFDLNKRLLTEKTNENGLKMQFSYDGYRRLKKIDDRYQTGDIAGTEQATMEYDYKYQNVANGIPYSYVETKTWYRGVTNTTPNTDKMVSKQYLDGLGRPLSIVKEYYTPTQQHQKMYVLYDNLGRQDKVYQPLENLNSGVDANLGSVLSGKPYVQTLYEASPLSRPLKQIMEDGRNVQTQYTSNSANEVRAFTVIMGRVSDDQLVTVNLNGYYAANTLYKTIVWDENGTNGTNNQSDLTNRFVGRTEIFKDKLDRVILTRKFVKNAGGSFVNVDTYNIYDDYSNLVMVIPPDAVSTAVNYSLVYQYNYDNLNRLIEKKIPGAKYIRFYYNDRDLMVLMQDGNMRNASYGNTSNTGAGNAFKKKYLATVYDAIGRPIKTGFTGSSFPTLTLGQDFEVTDANIFTRISTTEFYRRDANGTINPNGALSTTWVKHQEAKVLKNTSVSTVRENVWSYMERRASLEYTGNPIWTGKQHLLCTTKRYGWMDVGDERIDDNDYGGVDWRVSGYNGAQMPTINIHYAFSSNYAQEVRTADFPTYDHALRMTNLDHAFSMGGAGLPPQTNISNMVYNYKDQLTQKNLAYNTSYLKYLQNIDYYYNVRGWLTNINQLSINCSSQPIQIMTPQSPSSGPIQNLAITPFINNMANDIANKAKRGEAEAIAALVNNTDLFSQTINYDTPDSRFGDPDKQYNGNISNTFWQVAGRAIQGYGFKYDDLNRLTEGNYYDVACSSSQATFTGGKFTEKVLEYDLRGNIKKLQRFGFKEPSINTNNDVVGNYGEIDNLTYTYDPSNLNRIQTITDFTTDDAHITKGFKYNSLTSSPYTYDDNGNMITDPNKGLTINYNYLNLPETITMPSGDGHVGVIQFVYDASGQKHRRIVKKLVLGVNGVTTTDLKITDYVGGYEYEVTNPISDNGVVLNPANSLPSRIHHTEGAITKEANSNVYQYEYVLRDHLGNTRVTFKDKNNDADIEYSSVDPSVNEVSQINHFYPFGLNMEGNWNGANGNNKYTYNAKEWNDDFGLGLSDYGARWYQSDAPHWLSIDPLAEKYYSLAPYNYVANNPLKYIDPDGQDIILIFRSTEGESKVRYGSDGKLYSLINDKEYKENHPFFNAQKTRLDNIREAGGAAAAGIENLIRSEAHHKITNFSKTNIGKNGSENGRDIEDRDNGRKGGTLTVLNPAKDLERQTAKGVNYSATEILGHEMKHGYNIQNNLVKSNSRLTVVSGRTHTGGEVGANGEEVDAVNYQNLIRQNERPWMLPRSEYGVDISSKLATPKIVVPFIDKIGY